MTAMDIRGRSRFLRTEFPGGTLLLDYKPRRESLLRCVRMAELLVDEDLDASTSTAVSKNASQPRPSLQSQMRRPPVARVRVLKFGAGTFLSRMGWHDGGASEGWHEALQVAP